MRTLLKDLLEGFNYMIMLIFTRKVVTEEKPEKHGLGILNPGFLIIILIACLVSKCIGG